MKSALIIGANGTIGSALEKHLRKNKVAVQGTSRKGAPHLALNLENPDAWPELPVADVTYLCAAITKLDECEQNPEATRIINVERLQKIAKKLLTRGSFVVFLSSNQVFDGGMPARDAEQKAEFERWLLTSRKPAAILRLTKVISEPLPIIHTWKKALLAGQTIEAFDDLVMAPITLSNTITALEQIGQKKRAGIFQLSGEDISYFQLAKRLAKSLNVSESLVSPISAQSKGILPQFLPQFGSLKKTPNLGLSDKVVFF
jgi:dTDP-4-dehydrorhamnose reductase